MLEVHHFAYGWFNPVMAFGLAFLGSLLGLGCTARARDAGNARRRARWLALGAISIGGAGIWLMHFMAMLGFAVPAGEVRYDPGLTTLSLVIAVVTVGIGLFVVGMGRRTVPRLIGGGTLTGLGVVSMHYTGMAAVRLPGEVHFDSNLVAASIAIAIVAATVALWFAVSVRRGAHLAGAALLMAVAIAGMHYTGMAAVHVELTDPPLKVSGMTAMLLIVPMTVLAAGALLATAFNALQAMTEEELDAPLPPPEPVSDSAATAVGQPAPGFPPPGWRRGSGGRR